MNYFGGVIFSGILATLAMTLAMYFVQWSKLANGDMIRALGSFFTPNPRKGFFIGLVLHYTVGCILAFIYFIMFGIFSPETETGYLSIGALMGLAHGFVVSFIMIILVAEHHPQERFRNIGFPVALIHILGHVVYGTTLGYFAQRFQLIQSV